MPWSIGAEIRDLGWKDGMGMRIVMKGFEGNEGSLMCMCLMVYRSEGMRVS